MRFIHSCTTSVRLANIIAEQHSSRTADVDLVTEPAARLHSAQGADGAQMPHLEPFKYFGAQGSRRAAFIPAIQGQSALVSNRALQAPTIPYTGSAQLPTCSRCFQDFAVGSAVWLTSNAPMLLPLCRCKALA